MLEPIVAGDTLAFTRSLPDYPASAGWTLTFRLVPRAPSGSAVTFSAAASGDDHAVSVPASTTAGWADGAYGYAAYAELDGARHTVERGQVEILSDPSAVAVGTDSRTHAEKMLAAIEAMLQGRATKAQSEIRIGERMLRNMAPKEIEEWRDLYRREVADETRRRLGITSRDVFVRFRRA